MIKSIQGIDNKFRGTVGGNRAWTLCVGAGVSAGIIPIWSNLTKNLVNKVFEKEYSQEDFVNLTKQLGWGLDSLLQACANEIISNGESVEKFNEYLEYCLYKDVLEKIDQIGLRSEFCQALNNPRKLRVKESKKLLKFFDDNYANTTLVKLSKVLVKSSLQDVAPQAIINFNADTLLYAYLDLCLIQQHSEKIGRWLHPSVAFRKVLRGASGIIKGTVPIYHCHGALYPATTQSKSFDSRDQLVFLEESYLNIASSMATWAQSLFLYHAQHTNLVIAGHSLADPNIRKWLNWSFESSRKEIQTLSEATHVAPRHIWITKAPADEEAKYIQEVGLTHLGVRVCWINEWNEVDAVLENLLAI